MAGPTLDGKFHTPKRNEVFLLRINDVEIVVDLRVNNGRPSGSFTLVGEPVVEPTIEVVSVEDAGGET